MNGINNSKSRPLGVQLIAGIYACGAIVLLVSIFISPAEVSRVIAERHGLLPIVGVAILPVAAVFGLAIAYGLYSLSRWGFYLTIAYLICFGGVSIALGGLNFGLTGQAAVQMYFGNFSWSVLVVIYLLIVRRHFFGSQRS